MSRKPTDPTRVTSQPALTSSTGRRWLVWGGVLAGVSIVILAALAIFRVPEAWIACGVIAALYAAMIAVRLAVAPQPGRLLALAWLMGVMAVVGLVSIIVMAALSAQGG